ncbi:MAG: penicillin-binding protein activator [Citromicrobium sp.]|nr:MAG: penicillin-binding protein activator [Citromicrobium sp.]
MKRAIVNRRTILLTAAATLMAGCSIIPKTGPTEAPPSPSPVPSPGPSSLPQDERRHRVALLVPLSGDTAGAGQSIANATTMAILDTNAENLRITTYDTAKGPEAAAREAIADGNRLILGPLLGSNVASVRQHAAAAGVPIISFSNDTSIAGPGVFVMGHVPEQSVGRSVGYARSKGADAFAVLVPESEYGKRAEASFRAALREHGGRVVATERYDRANTSVISAAGRLKSFGGYDAVFIGDGGQSSVRAGEAVSAGSGNAPQLIGTERWDGELAALRSSELDGAIFAAVRGDRFPDFVKSYESRFGGRPYRIATLGYDAVLLTLRASRDWTPGRPFPVNVLFQDGGFDGMDGIFRFQRNGVVQRAMEVRQIRNGEARTVSAAPSSF